MPTLTASCLASTGHRSTAISPSVASVRLEDGGFAINAINSAGTSIWQSAVGARCHGGCLHPSGKEVIIFERRPGWSLYVLDRAGGHQKHQVKADKGEHFYGHGVFSGDGRWLYATASDYESGEGIIAVYDSTQNYQRAQTIPLNGTGPHELKLHPDGKTLVVALGGIRTHPDYDRIKLNRDTMKPALMLVDRSSGETMARFSPSHHQLSCRHLDICQNGHIYAGYQYQGPEYHSPALVCRYRNGRFDEIRFPERFHSSLKNYIASVAAHPESGLVAITAPRGGLALVFDGGTGNLVSAASIKDCAGVKPLPGGDFLVSSGTGALFTISPGSNSPTQIASLPMQWDNHLI
jgi:hypothetical protein